MSDEAGAPAGPAAAAATRFPCAQCGAALGYDPGIDRLACGYCGHAQPLPDLSPAERAASLAEIDYVRALGDQIEAEAVEERSSVKCDACGAETMRDEAATALVCAFCASPLVAEPGRRRQFKPKAVAPFLITERDARARLRQWLAGLWFAPGDLGRLARAGGPFTGVYLPYWTFDAATRSRYRGQRGDAYWETIWVTEMVDGRPRRVRRQVRKIRWRPASGRVARRFDDVLSRGSRSLPEGLAQRLDMSGWDLSALEPYQPEYLAGFTAEAYGVDLEEGYVAARAQMDFVIRRDVAADIGGDAQRVHRVETEMSDVTFKHVLLPIWIAAFRYRGEPYAVLVNGRTGHVAGRRPYSTWKIALVVVAGLAVAAGLAALIAATG